MKLNGVKKAEKRGDQRIITIMEGKVGPVKLVVSKALFEQCQLYIKKIRTKTNAVNFLVTPRGVPINASVAIRKLQMELFDDPTNRITNTSFRKCIEALNVMKNRKDAKQKESM